MLHADAMAAIQRVADDSGGLVLYQAGVVDVPILAILVRTTPAGRLVFVEVDGDLHALDLVEVEADPIFGWRAKTANGWRLVLEAPVVDRHVEAMAAYRRTFRAGAWIWTYIEEALGAAGATDAGTG